MKNNKVLRYTLCILISVALIVTVYALLGLFGDVVEIAVKIVIAAVGLGMWFKTIPVIYRDEKKDSKGGSI